MRTSSDLLVTFAVYSSSLNGRKGLEQEVTYSNVFATITIILLFSLTFKSTKQISTPPSDVLVIAGDKQ